MPTRSLNGSDRLIQLRIGNRTLKAVPLWSDGYSEKVKSVNSTVKRK
jgi:hypothetical protein